MAPCVGERCFGACLRSEFGLRREREARRFVTVRKLARREQCNHDRRCRPQAAGSSDQGPRTGLLAFRDRADGAQRRRRAAHLLRSARLLLAGRVERSRRPRSRHRRAVQVHVGLRLRDLHVRRGLRDLLRDRLPPPPGRASRDDRRADPRFADARAVVDDRSGADFKIGHNATIKIIEQMSKARQYPAKTLPEGVPKIDVLEADRAKMQQVFGKKGEMLRDIEKATLTRIDTQNLGRVSIASDKMKNVFAAKKAIYQGLKELEKESL